MDVTTVQTHTHDTRIDLHWSSLATEPAIWMRIQGGASIDPRDPQRLALPPITNAAGRRRRHGRRHGEGRSGGSRRVRLEFVLRCAVSYSW